MRKSQKSKQVTKTNENHINSHRNNKNYKNIYDSSLSNRPFIITSEHVYELKTCLLSYMSRNDGKGSWLGRDAYLLMQHSQPSPVPKSIRGERIQSAYLNSIFKMHSLENELRNITFIEWARNGAQNLMPYKWQPVGKNNSHCISKIPSGASSNL